MKNSRTINELFNWAVEENRDREFLRYKAGGEWKSLTYGEVARRVRELALGLYDLGLRPGERIAIWSENRPEWNIADLATLALGAADVPIYTTQARDQVAYILKDSESRGIFVSKDFLAEAIEMVERVPTIEWIIAFDTPEGETFKSPVITAAALIERGRALFGEQPALYEQLWQNVQSENLATLLYTSGTTGEPKGVMLTHGNLTANTLTSIEVMGLENRHDLALTYLPLTHIFERGVWYVYMAEGATIAYAESIDKVAQNLQEVWPTAMTSVPRMFEKIYARIVERGMSEGFPKKQIFAWSLDVGRRWAELKDRGQPVGWWLSLKHKIADVLVFKKWREAVGGNIRTFVSGGAPLAPELAYLFYGAGMKILQGYGLTETSPVISTNTEEHNRIGTCGRIVKNVEVKFDEDGEILVKGPNVMKGYYNRPDENARSFTEDGWFRTGDIGHLDSDGYLVITDRKKEMIKTSGGKYVAPQRVESLIKSSPFVSQVVVVGNNRKFCSALIVPNMELIHNYAKIKGIEYENDDALLNDPRVLDLMQRQVDKVTGELARFEKVKKIALLRNEMTIESGELTPTLKPRRGVIEKKYAEIIDRLYEESDAQKLATV